MSQIKHKKWDAMLKRPDLDYTDLFSELTGKLPGLTVWQMENFYPVELEESTYTYIHSFLCLVSITD